MSLPVMEQYIKGERKMSTHVIIGIECKDGKIKGDGSGMTEDTFQ